MTSADASAISVIVKASRSGTVTRPSDTRVVAADHVMRPAPHSFKRPSTVSSDSPNGAADYGPQGLRINCVGPRV